jgi:hypothetical protein
MEWFTWMEWYKSLFSWMNDWPSERVVQHIHGIFWPYVQDGMVQPFLTFYNILLEYSKHPNKFVLNHFISSTQTNIEPYQIMYHHPGWIWYIQPNTTYVPSARSKHHKEHSITNEMLFHDGFSDYSRTHHLTPLLLTCVTSDPYIFFYQPAGLLQRHTRHG